MTERTSCFERLAIRWMAAAAAAAFAIGGLSTAARGQVWHGWPDPVANHVIPYQNSDLTHGPLLGRATASSMRVWVRTKKPGAFRVVYATGLPLSEESPGAEGETAASRRHGRP